MKHRQYRISQNSFNLLRETAQREKMTDVLEILKHYDGHHIPLNNDDIERLSDILLATGALA